MTCYSTLGQPARELEPGYPDPNPSWWHFNKEQRHRIYQMVSVWFKTICLEVVKHLPNAQEVITALDSSGDIYNLIHQYPEQQEEKGKFTYPNSQDNLENNALMWLRSEAARKASEKVIKEFWINKVYFSCDREDSVIGMRWIDRFHGILTRAVYYKLIPVVTSLRWMLDLSNLRNNCGGYGPHGENFKNVLSDVALGIAKTLCHKMHEYASDLMKKEMVFVLYENGPIYLEKT
jgi:hypothetical protein